MHAQTQPDRFHPGPLCNVAPSGDRVTLVANGVPSIQPTSSFVEQLVDATQAVYIARGPFEHLVRINVLYRWPMSATDVAMHEPHVVAWRRATPSNSSILSSCLSALREGGLLGSTSYVCDTTTRKVAVDGSKAWVGALVEIDEINDLEEVAL